MLSSLVTFSMPCSLTFNQVLQFYRFPGYSRLRPPKQTLMAATPMELVDFGFSTRPLVDMGQVFPNDTLYLLC